MLSKEEYIAYWKRTAQDSWDTALYLQEGKRNVEALFMYCLTIEKLLKANWVLDNAGNYPPRIHDLQSLHNQTDVELTSEQIDLLDTINRWNIEGRYPDYRFKLSSQATNSYVAQQVKKIEELRLCLLARI